MMAAKHFEMSSPDSCLNKAADAEPIFVLCAQDMLAPTVIRFWAELAEMTGSSSDKVDEAISLAEEMTYWPERKFPD